MQYSRETRNFVHSLVHAYVTYSEYEKRFDVNIDQLAEFDLEKLCAHLMLDNPDRAREATCSDNPHYETSMLPALTLYLKDTCHTQAKENFANRWRKGIVFYFFDEIESLLDDALADYNAENAA